MPAVHIASQGEIQSVTVPLKRFCEEDEQCKAGSVDAFIGIPFAQPPIGPLRWRRPQVPAPAWEGVRKSAWQHDPIQELLYTEYVVRPRRNLDRDEDGHKSLSEDCLYLNVWRPSGSKEGDKLPVLVWVYGGGCIAGSTSQPVHDGARLAQEANCVFVSVTYRLGPFGWLASRELAHRTKDEGTGNYGLWDVTSALQWVQKNIRLFGGDASNVTVWGESAGSLVIHAILLSPAIPPDLFCRAILNSGVILTKPPRTMAAAQATFDAIVTKLAGSASMSEEEKIEVLCNASTKEIFKASQTLPAKRPRTEWHIDEVKGRGLLRMEQDQSKIQLEAQSIYGPVWDGVTVPADLLELASKGIPPKLQNGRKGIMVGHCADEGSHFCLAVQTPTSLQRLISGYHPLLMDEIKSLYAITSAQSKEEVYATAAAMTGDDILSVPVRDFMLQLANQTEVPASAFLFAHRPSKQALRGHASSEGGVQLQTSMAATHSFELPFCFGNDGSSSHIFERDNYPGQVYTSPGVGFTVEEQHLSLHLMRSFSKFMRQESPWTPLNNGKTVGSIEDCEVLTMGRFASLGSNTPAALAAAREGGVPIKVQSLGDHLAWSQRVGSCGTSAERHAFWSGDNFKNFLLNSYGDDRISFIP